MTTNIEWAVGLIANATIPPGTSIRRGMDRASLAAQDLAYAGLLMQDLPAPRTVDRYPGSVSWEACIDPSVAARRHVWVRVDHMGRIKTDITGEVTPDEAREAAYALLAAANHTEQEQGDV